MDLTLAAQYVGAHVTPLNIGLFVLLIVSEVFGSVDRIKTSSIYMLGKTLLLTLKDQAWPQPVSVAAPAQAATPDQPKAVS